jgi:RimJ/RimL family protein N-acetyltransferase
VSARDAPIEEFWAVRLGCSPKDLAGSGLALVAHPQPKSLFALATATAVVVAAPPAMHAGLRTVPDPRALVTRAGLAPLVPASASFVGPARIAYLHRALAAPGAVARFEAASDSRLRALRENAGPEAWAHANLEAAEPPLFGCLAEGRIVAAAGFQRLLARVAHVGVVTDPAHRGSGLGRTVVEAAGAHALELGLLVQYQTLASNAPSLRIAESLGFEPFATTLAARW